MVTETGPFACLDLKAYKGSGVCGHLASQCDQTTGSNVGH